MTLIGIDIGSSTIKVAAYNQDGSLIAVSRESLNPIHPGPGMWEIEPEEVWNRTMKGLNRLVVKPALRRDPPRTIGISASGREAFPLDLDGNPLGACIMAGDIRECGLEEDIRGRYSPEIWLETCGHIPERMDPICRMIWWKMNRTNIMSKAKYFLGWHEFTTLKLTGRAVTDRSLASKWLVYDLKTHQWSPELLSEFDIDLNILPEIQPWGSVIGTLKEEIASELGISTGVEVGVGCFDASCTALGTGVSDVGRGCLLSGSWEDLIIPIETHTPATELINTGFWLGPHPGKAGLAILALSPNGTSAVDWVRNLVNMPLKELDPKLRNTDTGPSPVLAIPHLSGSTIPWKEGRRYRGAFMGLTLSSSPIDMVKSLMESIVYDLFYTNLLLKETGIDVEILRAAGGGIRSEWWTQLKADLLNKPIASVNQPEPGTLGAAILAGYASGFFPDIEQAINTSIKVCRRYEPDPQRAKKYLKQIQLYKSILEQLSAFNLHTNG